MKNRFSMIELLVVIAIISILVSLLFPALQQARLRGQDIACKSNIKHLMLAHILYEQTYEAFARNLLKIQYDGNERANTPHWLVLAGTGFLPKPPANHPWEWFGYGVAECPTSLKGSMEAYAMNHAQYGYNLDGVSENFVSFKQVRRTPGRLIFLIDAVSSTAYYDTADWGLWNWFDGTSNNIAAKHFLGANTVYVDGHVGYVKRSQRPSGLQNKDDWYYDKN